MGRRIVVLSDTFLNLLFGEGEHHYEVTRDAFPADARVINAQMEFLSGRVLRLYLLVESGAWEEGLEGAAYPLYEPRFARLYPEEGEFVPRPGAVES